MRRRRCRVTLLQMASTTGSLTPPILRSTSRPATTRFFGSLTRWHGIETMIAAIDNDEWPADVDLIIVGDGQLSAMVREAAGRNPRTQALPSVNQETLAGYIRGAAMGLVPINSVGDRGRFGVSPLKLYETLACGTPVVVTEFAEQAELVR